MDCNNHRKLLLSYNNSFYCVLIVIITYGMFLKQVSKFGVTPYSWNFESCTLLLVLLTLDKYLWQNMVLSYFERIFLTFCSIFCVTFYVTHPVFSILEITRILHIKGLRILKMCFFPSIQKLLIDIFNFHRNLKEIFMEILSKVWSGLFDITKLIITLIYSFFLH